MGSNDVLPDGSTLLLGFAALDRLYQIVLVASIVTGILLLGTALVAGSWLFALLGAGWLVGGPGWVAAVRRYES